MCHKGEMLILTPVPFNYVKGTQGTKGMPNTFYLANGDFLSEDPL